MKHYLKSLLLGVLAFFCATMSYAQITTASMSGVIRDTKGEPVIGAAIVATHQPSGTKYGAVTNVDGRFTIQGMRTGGPYKVVISNLGYQSVIYKDIYLKLGQTYVLNQKLKESSESLTESVLVASPKSAFTGAKIGASTNISTKQIQNIPTATRSITDITKLSPFGGNGLSFAGGDGRSTNFTLDGANMNNNFGLSASLAGGGNPVSIDAIKEMQVVVSPYDVRQTNFIGGGVNAITKSGTNVLKGSAYAYYRNENMRGNRVAGQELAPRESESNSTLGLTLGGPIIKNKLFFFVNFERENSPVIVNKWNPSTDGMGDVTKNISAPSKDEMAKVADFTMKNFGYNPGFAHSFTMPQLTYRGLARIDWNISMNHTLALRYNFARNSTWNNTNATSVPFSRSITRYQSARTSQSADAFSNSAYSFNHDLQSVALELHSRFSNTVSNQLLATYTYIRDYRGSNSKPFPFIDIANNKDNYIALGYELFSWNNDLKNSDFNIKDDITLYLENHQVTAGLSYDLQGVSNSFMPEGTGYYRFDSLDDFLTSKAPAAAAITYGYGGNQHPASAVSYSTIGAYIQDEYNVNSKLKITAGLRLDTYIFNNSDLKFNKAIYDLNYNGQHFDTGKWPNTNVLVSPRLGFVYDVFGDNTLKLRAGTGLFAGRLPLVFFTNLPQNSAMFQNTAVADSKVLSKFIQNGKLVTDRHEIVKIFNDNQDNAPAKLDASKGVAPYNFAVIDRKFKMPQIWKTSIALDYQLPTSFPLSVSGEFIFNKNVNATRMLNANIKSDVSSWVQKLPQSGNRYYYPYKQFTYTGTDAFLLKNTSEGYGWISTFGIKAEPIKGLNLVASYTHTAQYEISGLPGSRPSSIFQNTPSLNGPNFLRLHQSQYVIPNRVVLSLSYADKAGNSYGILYQGYNSGFGTYVYKGDINGDKIANDLVYVGKPEDMNFVKVGKDYMISSDPNGAAVYKNFLNKSEYLTCHIGKFAETNGVLLPWVNRIDLRYSHDFNFKLAEHKNTIRFSVDCMNIGNLINSSWGVTQQLEGANYGSRSILTPVYKDVKNPNKSFKYTSGPANFAGYQLNIKDSSKEFDYVYSASQCWYVQVGVKYLF